MDTTPEDRPSGDPSEGMGGDAVPDQGEDFVYADPDGDADLPISSPPTEEVDVAVVVAGSLVEASESIEPLPILERFEKEVHELTVELHRVESDVRGLLGDRDPRRKRKLSGTSRWRELEDDILSWRFTDRYDEPTLGRLQELVTRFHYLFHRLRSLAATRPVLNS